MNESNYGRTFHVFEIEGFLVNLFYTKCIQCTHLLKDVHGKITKFIGKSLNIILHISSEEMGGPSP